jgi:hypothetical protein
MTRKELANKVFEIVCKYSIKNDIEIWQAIAETDDKSLLSEYEILIKREVK